MLSGKNILLGVTGGIAAYKTASLTRLLVKEGAHVQVVLTREATRFVTPLTLSTLSKRPALLDFVDNDQGSVFWNNHVEWGQWADAVLIAPATANTLAKMAAGLCDNLLMAVYMSAKCPVCFAPAMDLDMFAHPSTSRNIATLKSFGHTYIPVAEGELASGLTGPGRMAEPEDILEALQALFGASTALKGKRVLISAGPTWEAIDSVRFLGNRSTGTMGYELARRAVAMGAEVKLVSGPVAQPWETRPGLDIEYVESALQMKKALEEEFGQCDYFISAAAVADYRPREFVDGKISKKEGSMQLTLERTEDILLTLGQRKRHQKVIGFALEDGEETASALSKMERKNLDAIVLNSLRESGAGFGTSTNKITWLDTRNTIKSFDLKSKRDVAEDIWNEILSL